MSQPNFIESLTKELKPSKPPLPWPLLLLRLSFLSAFISTVIIVLHGLKAEISVLVGRFDLVLESSMLLACIGIAFRATGLSAIPGRLQAPRLTSWILAVFLLAFLLSLAAHGGWQIDDQQAFLQGMSCSVFIIVSSILPLLFGFREIRRQASTQPRLSALLLSLGVLSAAILVQHLICPADDAPHLLVWHSMPLFILVGVSAFIGPKIFRW